MRRDEAIAKVGYYREKVKIIMMRPGVDVDELVRQPRHHF
jgi:hypothetical protein